MFDSTLRSYLVRSAMRISLAGAIVVGLSLTGGPDARQSPSSERGHATLTGRAEAIDGDTLVVGGIRVRLEGIDAPEVDQTCTGADGRPWTCGRAALSALAELVQRDVVRCEERGLDKYRRLLGVCHANGVEINRDLVRRGLAWAFTRYSQSYVSAEADARARRVGIWSGKAQPAWEYRAARWQTEEASAPSGCAIKGNVTANGRIYHLPWSPWYGRVKMDDNKGKRWFCSEAEAIAAGWRAAHVN